MIVNNYDSQQLIEQLNDQHLIEDFCAQFRTQVLSTKY